VVSFWTWSWRQYKRCCWVGWCRISWH